MTDLDMLLALGKLAGVPEAPIRHLVGVRDLKFPESRPRYWGVIDFTQHSSKKRLYVFDVVDAKFTQHHVAHGKGSDPKFTGFAKIFSNVSGSACSSLGVYRTSKRHDCPKHGLELRLVGLEDSNSHAEARAIVFHRATYMSDSYIKENGKAGRSEGCPAVSVEDRDALVPKLEGGSFIIAWHPELKPLPGPQPKPEPAKKEDVKSDGKIALPWDGRHKDASKWTAHLFNEVSGSKLMGLPVSDGETFHQGYSGLSRYGLVLFWMNLIAKMAKFESDYRPECFFKEEFADSKGNRVVSRGLLQISIESANAYPGIHLTDAQQLHDPYVNLTCTVKIMERLVSKHGRIAGKGTDGKWKGVAAYWSCMQSTIVKKNSKTGEKRTVGREQYEAIRAHVLGLKIS